MDTEFNIIETTEKLEKLVHLLENQKMIAVDLEADSLYHYKEKVCLIQVASNDSVFVVDPLKIKDMSSFAPLFSNKNIQKVFHGGDYDVRSLFRDFNIKVSNLFDTQIALRFLGYRQTSLETAVKTFFNIRLDKKYQKKNWAQRPLPGKMVEYAAGDAIYLIPLAHILIEKLKKIDRLAWVFEECHELSKVRPNNRVGQPLYLYFKGAGRLDQESLSVLEGLLQYRKKMAQKKDKPLFKIIGNQTLLKIAKKKPMSIEELKKLNVLGVRQASLYDKALVNIVNRELLKPKKSFPAYPIKKAPRLSPKLSKRVKIIKKWRNQMAERLSVEPSLLCNKTVITNIAIENPQHTDALKKINGMKKWCQKSFGKEIVAALRDIK